MNRRGFVRVSGLGLAGAVAARFEPLLAEPGRPKARRTEVPAAVMRQVHERVRTPYKYGVVLRPEGDEWLDIPCVFRWQDAWYMLYLMWDATTRRGYETRIASSPNLLEWTPLGTTLPFRGGAWDSSQAAGSISLQHNAWAEPPTVRQHDGKYWLSYLGGTDSGYETGSLGIGMAYTDDPSVPRAWTRFDAPVLSPGEADARWWEKSKLYRSNVIYDPELRLGAPYVMYYNAADERSVERIGMAVSSDMLRWTRYGADPVIDNGSGISGDPQVVRMGDLFVMFYFGAFWRPGAFDTFACSYDLVHWTKWTGPDLVAPSESYDATYAHKPWVICHDGVVYHFYNGASRSGRRIALATSIDLGVSPLTPSPEWSPGRLGNAVRLSSSPISSYVSLPSGIVAGLGDFTIAAWVNHTRRQERTRVFDFGTGAAAYMYLAASAGSVPRYAICTGGAGAEQQVAASAPLAGGWQHLAVTLRGASCTLYLNGEAVGVNAGMTLRPSDLGRTTDNWIGRSRGARDPYLNALVDDFQIHDRALGAAEVRALAGGRPGDGNVASYRFDEAAGATATDSSGNGRHATVVADW